MADSYTREVFTDSPEQTAAAFGTLDANIRAVEDAFGAVIRSEDTDRTDGSRIVITAQSEHDAELAAFAVTALLHSPSGADITAQELGYIIDSVREGKSDELDERDGGVICLGGRGKPIRAMTAGQKRYVDAIRGNTVIFGVGPAGTGKTYLAVALAVDALRKKSVNKIILTRPAVEAGERLGFLPGDLQSKIDPYLRPLYDAMYDMLGAENCAKYIERGTIEVAPLAYMRGRTLSDSFIILDEAQNTTREQMKMFLTRLGFNSKMIVTGDTTQIDLPDGKPSGLIQAVRILDGINGIYIHRFSGRDVVRHRLVQDIVNAYERGGAKNVRTDGDAGEAEASHDGESDG